MPGPQPGAGREAVVADWWLAIACDAVEETEAAAAPAITATNKKIRRASFIVSYSYAERCFLKCHLSSTFMLVQKSF